MSVLVKGMEMPSNCDSCEFMNYEDVSFELLKYCRMTGMYIDDSLVRPYDCPLVEFPEHHGRLIDAEFLKEHLYTCATNGRPLHRMYQELDELLEAINDIPTIIEAEGADE